MYHPGLLPKPIFHPHRLRTWFCQTRATPDGSVLNYSHSPHTHPVSSQSSRRVGTPRRYLRLGLRPPYVHRGRLLGSHLHLGTRRSGCATCSIGGPSSWNPTSLGPKWKRHTCSRRSPPSSRN